LHFFQNARARYAVLKGRVEKRQGSRCCGTRNKWELELNQSNARPFCRKAGLPLPQNRAVNVEIERYSVVPAKTTAGVERDPNDPITSDRRRNLITPIGRKTG
jgi:5-formaminoimidazole-4-carboxamide-1-beta-D-ribofuranosyl 5'-monophosphate synthetase